MSGMRIEPTITIRIVGRTGTAELFAGIRKGSELTARIVERVRGHEAVLEIAGKRIHAEFLKGIPADTMITLKLDDVKNNSFFFKLVDEGGKESFVRQIMEATIFDGDAIRKNILSSIGSTLSRNPAGIFELNALLLGHIQNEDKKEGGLTRLLNHLLKLGISKQAVSDLSFLLSGMAGNAKSLRWLLLMPGFDKDRLRKWASANNTEMMELVNSIFGEIDAVQSAEEKESIIRQIAAFLKDPCVQTGEYSSGEFVCFGEEELYPARYAGRENSWIFSVDFSALGRIEILAKKTGGGNSLSIFCDKNEALDALKNEYGQLQRDLALIDRNIHINFFNTRQVINKIVEIYSYYSLHSVLDIRA
jgi:hypothetical protein